MFAILYALNLNGQSLESTDIATIIILVILEGVLSIDNALVLGLLAKRLPRNEQNRALTLGLVGAFVFRVIAVCTASFLLKWTIAKFLGGAYLVYIAVKHLFFEHSEKEQSKVELDEFGHPKLTDVETGGPLDQASEEVELRERQPLYMDPETRKRLGLAAFWPTVLIIELTDIAFAVDSILAAIAFVGSPGPGHNPAHFHPKLWLVVVGGMLGVILMRYAAKVFINLLEKFPRFEISAYLLVIVIGSKLLLDWGLNSDWSFHNSPWLTEKMGPAWKETFEGVEKKRLALVDDYHDWLEANWVFPPSKWEETEHEEDDLHTPHLLNFHQNSRPEAISFWSLMAICFGIGFIPQRTKKEGVPLGEQST
jgi:YkoY family integral membrane protein